MIFKTGFIGNCTFNRFFNTVLKFSSKLAKPILGIMSRWNISPPFPFFLGQFRLKHVRQTKSCNNGSSRENNVRDAINNKGENGASVNGDTH